MHVRLITYNDTGQSGEGRSAMLLTLVQTNATAQCCGK